MLDCMGHFIGTRRLQAMRMTRGEYNEYRGWSMPVEENPFDKGYMVKYADGTISWRAAKDFEETYINILKAKLSLNQAIEIAENRDIQGFTRKSNPDRCYLFGIKDGEIVKINNDTGEAHSVTFMSTEDVMADDWMIVYSDVQYIAAGGM